MQPPDHLKSDLMFCCQRLFQSKENNTTFTADELEAIDKASGFYKE